MKDYVCHYIQRDDHWIVEVDTFLALPDSELKRIARGVRWEWMEKLKHMDGLKDALRMSFIARALKALEDKGISQVRRAMDG
jgi:hypothetical protein